MDEKPYEEVGKDELWRCSKGHEWNGKLNHKWSFPGFTLQVGGGVIVGPFCWECLMEFLEANVSKIERLE